MPRDRVEHVANPDGTGLHQVQAPKLEGSWPYWSPDDSRLVGFSVDSNKLIIATVDGSVPVVIVPARNSFGTSSWQPRAVPIAMGRPVAPGATASPAS